MALRLRPHTFVGATSLLVSASLLLVAGIQAASFAQIAEPPRGGSPPVPVTIPPGNTEVATRSGDGMGVTFVNIPDMSSNQVFSTPNIAPPQLPQVNITPINISPSMNVSHITQDLAKARSEMASLSTGKFLLESNNEPVSVNTKIGKVKVGVNSKAFLNITPARIEVTALAGPVHSIVVESPKSQKVQLSRGEALIVANEQEFLIDCDQGDVVTGKLIFAGKPAQTRKIDLARYSSSEVTIAGSTFRIGNGNANERWGVKRSQVKPVLFHSGIAPLMTPVGPSAWAVNCGTVLANPRADVRFDTAFGQVTARKGTFFLLVHDRNAMRLINCTGTVKVRVDGRAIVLNSGHELLVTRHKPQEHEKLPFDGIARRRAFSEKAGPFVATLDEFDLGSLLFGSIYSDSLRQELLADKHTKLMVFKTIIALRMVTASHGNYSLSVPENNDADQMLTAHASR